MLQEFLLSARILLLVYVVVLIVQCSLFLLGLRAKKLDRRNRFLYVLVMCSFVLTGTHISVNVWGMYVAGTSVELCKTWRGVSVIMYPVCMTPVTVLLWLRQGFFYKLNMIRRTTPRWLLGLSTYIIWPTLLLFGVLVVFFIVLYFTPNLDIMEYKVKDGECISGKSKRFSSVFRAAGILCIILLHCVLLYLFVNPLRENIAAQANQAGRVLEVVEVKGSCRSNSGDQAHFKSIKDLDRALIKKMAIITGVVIAADVIAILLYVILKQLGVGLSIQSLVLDLQVLITSISNVMCWKHWRQILLPTCLVLRTQTFRTQSAFRTQAFRTGTRQVRGSFTRNGSNANSIASTKRQSRVCTVVIQKPGQEIPLV